MVDPIDLTASIAAKSDQLNADDLLGGSIIIKVTKVSDVGGDQPITISYEGDGGKPWLPCKTMRRVLVGNWGGNGAKYVGRRIELFRDASVLWAGKEVGGIRIKRMSNIQAKKTLSLASTRGKKSPITVEPLPDEAAPANALDETKLAAKFKEAASFGMKDLVVFWKSLSPPEQKAMEKYKNDMKEVASDADADDEAPVEVKTLTDDQAQQVKDLRDIGDDDAANELVKSFGG